MLKIDGRISAKDTRDLPDQTREYLKTATVQALQMKEDFQVTTEEKRGDNADFGRAGDYLCIGPAGEAWIVKREVFESTYVPVE